MSFWKGPNLAIWCNLVLFLYTHANTWEYFDKVWELSVNELLRCVICVCFGTRILYCMYSLYPPATYYLISRDENCTVLCLYYTLFLPKDQKTCPHQWTWGMKLQLSWNYSFQVMFWFNIFWRILFSLHFFLFGHSSCLQLLADCWTKRDYVVYFCGCL